MAIDVSGRPHSLFSSRLATLVVAFWILVVHLAGTASFISGFLLTRPVFENVSAGTLEISPSFERAVILVVDALRYDFAAPASVQQQAQAPYLNQLPFQEINSDPAQSFLLKFVADPPTTTLQRLKGLTTGSLPTIIDAGANFAGTRIDEDNWVAQTAKDARVVFAGDDTWYALYGHVFAEAYPYDSLNVRDLDTVDNGVKSHLPGLVANKENKVVIGHMLGVDHVGHRYGPNHTAMTSKLQETGRFIRELASLIDNDTLLLVFGDHGMDQVGNHGGDSSDELEAALWAYSKTPKFSAQGDSTVRQIDLVPTISALLGLAIPFNNLGFPISKAFGARDQFDQAGLATAYQLSDYAKEFGKRAFDPARESSHAYQQELLREFSESWVTFDMLKMSVGMIILGASILLLICLYNTLNSQTLSFTAHNMSIGALLGALVAACWVSVGASGIKGSAQMMIVLGNGLASGSLLGGFSALRILPVRTVSPATLLALLVLGAECATVFSNSFVIWEPRVLNYLLLSILVGLTVILFRKGPFVRHISIPYIISFAFLARLSTSLVVCREENGASCSTSFYEAGSSMTPTWMLFAVSSLSVALPLFLRKYFEIGQSYTGTAKLFLHGTTIAMIFVSAYWSIDTAEVRGYLTAGTLELPKVFLARMILAASYLGGLYIWQRSDLAISVNLSGEKPKIEGINNVYGSYASLALLAIMWGLLIVSKPPAILALCGFVYTVFAAFDLLDLAEAKYSMLAPVLTNLLSQICFYSTGHQATIVSIQWDSAFIATSKLSYPLSAVTVFLNTMGPFLFGGIATIVVATWRRAPLKQPKYLAALCLRAGLGASAVACFQALSSMVAVTILRRHLMTWKIFAPRFMFISIVLVILDVGTIAGLLITGHSIQKVTTLFQ